MKTPALPLASALVGAMVLAIVMFAMARWVASASGSTAYDPLETERLTRGRIANLEAAVPPMCYTKTGGVSNPCWTCHTIPQPPNSMYDVDLQETYAFSRPALTNHWTNLFADRSATIARISDDEILAYVRIDNYAPLRRALEKRPDYRGFRPDLDFEAGFDSDGFARDGSAWRALRYKPFPGTFWPTNGSTDDVFIRLPPPFRRDEKGRPSRAIEKLNLSILETAVATPPERTGGALDREVEPLDEAAAGLDLDGDGLIHGTATRIRTLPPTYVGGASRVPVVRFQYPKGTEFLHSVRYLDPARPDFRASRMKELRYSRKIDVLDGWAVNHAYENELDKKQNGHTPVYAGDAEGGLRNDFGWLLQGFIEDARGRLRLQTGQEARSCRGCHGGLGVTVDQTFALPRKVPGLAGWRPQDPRGIPDVPQAGHPKSETLTYFERVRGGDEFRTNDEILGRFFPGGKLDANEVLRAARGGDRDLSHLIFPSRERALLLNKAYRAIVLEQSFDRGRDAIPGPAANVHPEIENGSTELGKSGRVFRDGRLWLDWD